jgi:hypothetical protein
MYTIALFEELWSIVSIPLRTETTRVCGKNGAHIRLWPGAKHLVESIRSGNDYGLACKHDLQLVQANLEMTDWGCVG